jgi:hypothetical protein
LIILVVWSCVALALGMLIGRAMAFGERSEEACAFRPRQPLPRSWEAMTDAPSVMWDAHASRER